MSSFNPYAQSIWEAEQTYDVLPIDEFKEEIVRQIDENRVTIIQGETGCGKSSRVPLYLLEKEGTKFLVSQPRRIACRGLLNRMRSTQVGREHLFGMRLGGGIKDEVSGSTRCFFCSAGYIVRLLAAYPGHFDDHTHLIIDECHERSVDGDVLCLLAKRLLLTNPSIKIVLMSATLEADRYRTYFGTLFNEVAPAKEEPAIDKVPLTAPALTFGGGGVSEPIRIEVRKHKISTFFADDLEVRGNEMK